MIGLPAEWHLVGDSEPHHAREESHAWPGQYGPRADDSHAACAAWAPVAPAPMPGAGGGSGPTWWPQTTPPSGASAGPGGGGLLRRGTRLRGGSWLMHALCIWGPRAVPR